MGRTLSAAQHDRIADLIELHHAAFMVQFLGHRAVSKSVLERLKKANLYRAPRMDVLKKAFQFGRESIITPDVLKMDSKAFEQHMAKKGSSLTEDEIEAIDTLRRSFAAYVRSVSDTFRSKFSHTISKADRSLRRKLALRQQQKLSLDLERRKAIASIAKDLSDITHVQISDAQRVLSTETNNAYQDGRAQEIIRKAGDSDPEVFKRPRHDACDDCNVAYLEDDGKTPRIFRMSELLSNGTNVGKSRGQRQPVVDSFHPYCACELQWLPPGFGFRDGAMVYVGRKAGT